MGNNHQGAHALESCVHYPGRFFQLNMLDANPPTSLLSSYCIKNHIVFITYEAVESFSEMQKVSEYLMEPGHTIDCLYLSDSALFIADNNGIITVLEPVSLKLENQIKPAKLLPGRITSMLESHNTLYLGHLGGDITLWNATTGDFINEHLSSLICPIEHLALSTRYSLLIASNGSNTSETRLRVISTIKNVSKPIDGILATIVGILVYDEKNLIFAVDRKKNQLFLWDIITGDLLLSTLMPEFFPNNVASCICKTSLGRLGFAIGFTGNSVAWGEIKFSEEHFQYFFNWKGRSKAAAEGNVRDIRFCSETNGLVLSCDRPLVMCLNRLDEETKAVTNKKPLFALSEHEETNDYSTQIKVYQRALTNKTVTVNQDMIKKIRERLDGKKQEDTREVEVKDNTANIIKEKKNENADKKSEKNIEMQCENPLGVSSNKIPIENKPTLFVKPIEKKAVSQASDKPLIPVPSENYPKQSHPVLNLPSIPSSVPLSNPTPAPISSEILPSFPENHDLNPDLPNPSSTLPLEISQPDPDPSLSQDLSSEPSSNSFPVNHISQPEISESDSQPDLKPIQVSPPTASLPLSPPSDPSPPQSDNSSMPVSLPSEASPSLLQAPPSTPTEESKQTPQIPPEASKPPTIKKPPSPFQIYLIKKKPELLQENPTLSHKEIVLKVSQMWVELNETDKKHFESLITNA